MEFTVHTQTHVHRISQGVESGKFTSAQNIVFERKKTNHIAIVAGTEIMSFIFYPF
jgi:hypothetical protein